MRRRMVVSILAVLWFGLGAHAIPLCNYRAPVTNLSDLVISFSYQYHNDPFGLGERDVSEGQFGIEYVRLYDEPEFGFDVLLQNDMLISVLDESSYITVADANYKRYFSADEAYFAFAGGSARSSSSFESIGASLRLGVGYGRFSDVTAYAKATRIDEYLFKRGTLTDHLHPLDLQILADEIGSTEGYESLGALLAAVQEIIEYPGRVKNGGLDALEISEVTRLIEEEGFSRYCGWDVKVGLGYEIIDPSGGEKDLLINGAFDYAMTTTPDIQLLIQGSFSGRPAILETNRIDLTVAYDCLITNLLSLNTAYHFSRETWDGVPTDIHKVTADLVVEPLSTADVIIGIEIEHRPYYTEWNVDIKLSISMELL